MKKHELDDEIFLTSGSRLDRSRGRLRRVATADETREVDADYLESLLSALGDEAHPDADAGMSEEADLRARALHMEQERAERQSAEHADEQATGHDLADAWMRHSGKAPLLTAAQEVVLAKRIEAGDARARETMLNANVRLVAKIARHYLNRGLPLEDLMQEGLIGLMRAIDKYNYRRGYRFSTYATHWIRQAVSRGVANSARSVRLPAHVVDTIGRVARVREDLVQRLGRPPSRAEVAKEAGMTEGKLATLLRNAQMPVSLDSPVGEDGESRLGDFVPADSEASPASRVFKRMVTEELEKALCTLTPRERDVVELRFGLGEEGPLTLEETGRKLHITRERARQIERHALEKLRLPQTAGRLRDAVH